MLADVRYWSNGQITNAYHNQSPAAYVAYLKAEYPALAARTSYLQLGNYLINWRHFGKLMFKPTADVSGNDDSAGAVTVQYLIPAISHPQPFVCAERDSAHFARALILSAPAGTTMSGYHNEPVTMESYAALWSKMTGRRVASYRQSSCDEAVEAGMPGWLAAEVLAGGRFNGEFGASSGDPEV